MSIWNKVLLGLNILVTLGAFYFALQMLNIHEVWRESAQQHEKRLAQVNKEIENIERGPDGAGGIRALQMELYAEYAARGRVWYNCQPQTIKNTNLINVAIEQPSPKHYLEQDSVVYIFEYTEQPQEAAAAAETGDVFADSQTDEQKKRLKLPKLDKITKYLGEFVVVTTSGDIGVRVSPAMELNAQAIADLKDSKGPWMIYELMPNDSPKYFANMSEKEIRDLIPPEVVDEYIKDGKEGFVRELRDYDILLKWLHRFRTRQIEAKAAGTRYNKSLDATLADAEEQNKFRHQLNQTLGQELATMTSERDTVLAYETSLKKELRDLQQKIDNLMNKNRVLAQTIQEFQQEAILQIDSKTVSTR